MECTRNTPWYGDLNAQEHCNGSESKQIAAAAINFKYKAKLQNDHNINALFNYDHEKNWYVFAEITLTFHVCWARTHLTSESPLTSALVRHFVFCSYHSTSSPGLSALCPRQTENLNNSCMLEWFYFNREIFTTQIDTIRHLFHCFLLISFHYLALIVRCCFTGKIKSL